MTEKELKLRERIKENYAAYLHQLKIKPASKLIEMASEIAAAKFVYEELMVEGYFPDCTDYLLQFENPLEVVRDGWNYDYNNVDQHDELDHLLWDMAQTNAGVGNYAPAMEKIPPVLERGITLC